MLGYDSARHFSCIFISSKNISGPSYTKTYICNRLSSVYQQDPTYKTVPANFLGLSRWYLLSLQIIKKEKRKRNQYIDD